MSFYTVFEVAEAKVTSTTTAGLMAASDPILIHSSALKAKGQSTVGSVATLWPITTATTASTATAILPYGVVSVNASSASTTQSWLLSTATQLGQCVTILYNSTSTSSQNTVVTASTANMTFASTETYAGIALTFNQVPKAYYELTAMSVSTAGGNAFINPVVWMVTGRSQAGTLCT